MQHVTLPDTGTDKAWRDAARGLLAARTPPEDVTWSMGNEAPDLFAEPAAAPPPSARVKVPEAFVALANTVVWHREPERFARLYALLWRLRIDRAIMADPSDPDVTRLRQMEKNVRRCQHKMKAFVRFREIGPRDKPRRSFAAWFEPTHHTLEPTAPFFARRFADMDWIIATPMLTAQFTAAGLQFHPGSPRPDLPEDAAEGLWRTYFANIFNPARVKVAAMTSEMPRKYWKNLPEASLIPDLLASAEARVRAMHATAPTTAPKRAERIKARLPGGGAG
jgi:uracil-DNA glycosylase